MSEGAADDLTGLRFVVADVGCARFGVEVDRVLEVFALPECARVPGGPRWVKGAIIRGGRLVAVLDLGAFFRLADCAPPSTCVLIDDDEVAVAWAVGGVEVVEGRDTVRSIEPQVSLPDTDWIIDARLTSRLDFHRLDVARVLAGIRERF